MDLVQHNPKIPLFEAFSDSKCSRCTALCCRYFGLEIDTPEDERDFDQLCWFMLHKDVEIYVESGAWHLNVLLPCKKLEADNRCGTYETRPYLCRDYDTDGCEFETNPEFDHYFKSYDELVAYMRARGIPGAYLKPGEELPKPPKRRVLKKKSKRKKSAPVAPATPRERAARAPRR
jgi:uncharacterized protein